MSVGGAEQASQAPPADTLLHTSTPDSTTVSDTLAAAPSPAASDTTPSREPPTDIALRGHGRPNPIKAVWEGAKNYVSDMLYLYSSPIRMDGENVATLALVTGAGGALYAYDNDIYGDFQRSRTNSTYHALIIKAGGDLAPLGLISRTHLWLEGASITGWVLDVPLLRTIPGEILESNSIVGALRQPVERIVARKRPSDGLGPRHFSGGESFPSGHASVVCETASILSYHFHNPIARAVFWTAAGLVCLQRVDEPGHNHWPSDVWFGAALGTWAGHTIAVRNDERRRGIRQRKWYDILHRPPGH